MNNRPTSRVCFHACGMCLFTHLRLIYMLNAKHRVFCLYGPSFSRPGYDCRVLYFWSCNFWAYFSGPAFSTPSKSDVVIRRQSFTVNEQEHKVRQAAGRGGGGGRPSFAVANITCFLFGSCILSRWLLVSFLTAQQPEQHPDRIPLGPAPPKPNYPR